MFCSSGYLCLEPTLSKVHLCWIQKSFILKVVPFFILWNQLLVNIYYYSSVVNSSSVMYQQCYRSTDSLLRSDGALFSTLDQDNDGTQAKVCTSEYHSGWWHSLNAFCTEANLNGIYYPMFKSDKTGIFWFDHDEYFTLKEVRMMLRKP